MIGVKPLFIRFNKVTGFIKVYDRTIYFAFSSEKCDAIYNRIRYLVSQKSGITYVFFHNYAIIKIDSYDLFIYLQKTFTWHHFIILIKSDFNENQN